jgi:hypothetical protein
MFQVLPLPDCLQREDRPATIPKQDRLLVVHHPKWQSAVHVCGSVIACTCLAELETRLSLCHLARLATPLCRAFGGATICTNSTSSEW